MTSALADRFSARLRAARNADGGFGPRPGVASEPEPTAIAALALDDDDARAWLAARQLADGSWGIVAGPVVNVSATPLAAMALGDQLAIDYLAGHPARTLDGPQAGVPMDLTVRGWGWTADTFGWVEPTARGLLALRRLRPNTTAPIDDAVALLRDRACVEGGWNYGNREVWGVEMEPFVQPTAWALLGLQLVDDPMVGAGHEVLRARWAHEQGGLSLSLTALALRMAADNGPVGEVDEVLDALAATYDASGFLDDVATLGWAALAADPERAEALRIAQGLLRP